VNASPSRSQVTGSGPCDDCGSLAGEVALCVSAGLWVCEACAAPFLPRAPRDEERPARERSDPFQRPLDWALCRLRSIAPDAYRSTDELRRWRAKCPLHPDAGRTLHVHELPDGEVRLRCAVGCPEWALRYVLLPNPVLDARAGVGARWIVWRENYGRRRSAA
jgi:hypothetical protein